MTEIIGTPTEQPEARFATVSDVATRQGATFTEAQEETVDLLLLLATASITEAAGRDDVWALTVDPVPLIVRGLTVELVGRAMANTEGLTSMSEQLGSYQYMKSFNKEATSAVVLTAIERKIVRRTFALVNYGVRTPTATEILLTEDDSEE